MFFGFVHIFSASATLFSTLSIMLEAGILLGAAYILTQRLWLVIGIHIAWDMATDGIFGVGSASLSGNLIKGVLKGRLTGSILLSGGKHGVEASIITIVIASIIGCLLLCQAWRNGKIGKFHQIKGERSDVNSKIQ